MQLLDQYGKPVQSNLIKATRNDQQMPRDLTNARPFDISSIPYEQHLKLTGMSRSLYINNGIYKGICNFLPMWSIQSAFNLTYSGSNKESAQPVLDYLQTFWDSPHLTKDVNFRTLIYNLAVSMLVDGDVFILLVKDGFGQPKVIHYPSYAVGNGIDNDSEVVSSGRYKGNKIKAGIITDKLGRVKAYRFLTAETFTDVSAEYVLHLADLSLDATRGMPALTHGLKQFGQVDTSVGFELLSQMISSSISLVETNESGGMEDDQFGMASQQISSNETIVSNLMGGSVRYLKAGTGSDIKSLDTTRPSVQWNEFHKRIYKEICIGLNISDALIFNTDLPSVALRAALRACEITVNDYQDLLKSFASKIINFVISTGIVNGDIATTFNEQSKINFTLPPRLSLDLGRDSQELINGLNSNLYTLNDVLEAKGKTNQVEDHINQLYYEKSLKESAAKKYGVEV